MTAAREHVGALDLVDYVRGRMSTRAARRVRQHCVVCEDCGDQLAAVILLRGGVTARARTRSPLRAAAAVAACTVALWGWWQLRVPHDAAPVAGRVDAVEEVGVTVLEPEERALATRLAFAAAVAPASDADARRGRVLAEARGIWLRGDLPGLASFLAPFQERYDPLGTPLLAVAMTRTGRPGGLRLLRDVAARGAETGPDTTDSMWLYSVRELGRTLHARGESAEALGVLDGALASLDENQLVLPWPRRVLELRERIRSEMGPVPAY